MKLLVVDRYLLGVGVKLNVLHSYSRYWTGTSMQWRLAWRTREEISLKRDKGPFIFYEGGGAGGIWETPFKNRMTPPQLTNFFTWAPLRAVIFLDDPPRQDFTFLIFSIIPIVDVIVLTMKTKFTIPILQGALQLKKKQIKRKRN